MPNKKVNKKTSSKVNKTKKATKANAPKKNKKKEIKDSKNIVSTKVEKENNTLTVEKDSTKVQDSQSNCNKQPSRSVMSYLVIVVLLVFCLSLSINNAQSKKDEMETIPLYINPTEQLTEDSMKLVEDALDECGLSVGSVVDEDFFLGNAVKAPNVDLITSTGDVINLSQVDTPIVLEVIADWCGYCQQEEVEYLDRIVEANPNVTFVKYIDTGAEEEMKAFYDATQVEPNERVIIVYQNADFSEWLSNNDFTSYPTFYFINSEHKVSGSYVGLLDHELAQGCIAVAFSNEFNTYSLQTKYGISISRLARKVRKANQYLNELTEIDVPRSYLSGETIGE